MSLDLFTFKLASGSHQNAAAGTCFMEAVAWMAREKHSDAPQCACPVLGRFGIRLNDRMTDEERKALNPLILKMMNTRSPAHEEIRAAFLLHGVATRILSVVFDLRGWGDLAEKARAIPLGASRRDMQPVLRDIRDQAYQKRCAAYAAAAADAAYAAAAYAADAAAADAADAANCRKQFLDISVELLSQAIELGPHNGDEFYDMPVMQERIQAFHSGVLERA